MVVLNVVYLYSIETWIMAYIYKSLSTFTVCVLSILHIEKHKSMCALNDFYVLLLFVIMYTCSSLMWLLDIDFLVARLPCSRAG